MQRACPLHRPRTRAPPHPAPPRSHGCPAHSPGPSPAPCEVAPLQVRLVGLAQLAHHTLSLGRHTVFIFNTRGRGGGGV